MHPLRRPSLLALALLVAAPAFAAHPEVVRPLKTVVASVRYGRDKAALKHFDGEAQGKLLLGPSWDKATAAQREEFVKLFEVLFAKLAFPKVRTNFEHLESILYSEPKLEGDRATVDSTILILHPLKKQELKVTYALLKEKAGWKVVDVTVLGDSTLGGIRDTQVQPLIKDAGIDGLLKVMREKVKELEAVPLK
jgi:phospholipid transport system substrate-binding protein